MTLSPEVFSKALCISVMACTFSVQGLIHLHQRSLIFSLIVIGSGYFFQYRDGIPFAGRG